MQMRYHDHMYTSICDYYTRLGFAVHTIFRCSGKNARLESISENLNDTLTDSGESVVSGSLHIQLPSSFISTSTVTRRGWKPVGQRFTALRVRDNYYALISLVRIQSGPIRIRNVFWPRSNVFLLSTESSSGKDSRFLRRRPEFVASPTAIVRIGGLSSQWVFYVPCNWMGRQKMWTTPGVLLCLSIFDERIRRVFDCVRWRLIK